MDGQTRIYMLRAKILAYKARLSQTQHDLIEAALMDKTLQILSVISETWREYEALFRLDWMFIKSMEDYLREKNHNVDKS